MTTEMCLCSNPGSIAALPVVLLCDYLEAPLNFKTEMCCTEKCCRADVQACLCVSDSLCLTTTGSMMRYVVRSQNNTDLYKDDKVNQIEQLLQEMNSLESSLVDLNANTTKSKKLDKTRVSDCKKSVISGLKTVNTLLQNAEGLELNVSDFVVFSWLGNVHDRDLKKMMKQNKAFKKRWETLKKDEKFCKLMTPYMTRSGL